MLRIIHKEKIKILIIAIIVLSAPFSALAINDVTINGIVTFELLTGDTAAPTTILASAGGLVTNLDVQSNYIDITLDNTSTITFDTTGAGNYFNVITAPDPTRYTATLNCPPTHLVLNGVGAQIVVRIEVITTYTPCPGGGGGRTAIYPSINSFVINNNAPTTSSNSVTISMDVQNATKVAISNDSGFIGAVWEPFSNPMTKNWTLESGSGTKTVYALFKSSTGDLSNVISDSIEVTEGEITPLPVTPPVIPPVSGQPVSPPSGDIALNFGDVFKGTADTVYYYGTDGKRYIFPNRGTFLSWYPDFSKVKKVSDAYLSLIPVGSSNINYKPGVRMLKLQTWPDVYAVDAHGTLRWVTNETASQELYGLNWNTKIDDLNDAFFGDYKLGDIIRGIADFNPIEATNAAIDINTDKQIVI